MKIYVTNKACQNCIFMPDGPLSEEDRESVLKEFVETDGIMECPNVTAARRRGKVAFSPGELTCCFSYFYFQGRRNPYLREAIENHEIEYFDIAPIPSFRDMGYSLWKGEDGSMIETTWSSDKFWFDQAEAKWKRR